MNFTTHTFYNQISPRIFKTLKLSIINFPPVKKWNFKISVSIAQSPIADKRIFYPLPVSNAKKYFASNTEAARPIIAQKRPKEKSGPINARFAYRS